VLPVSPSMDHNTLTFLHMARVLADMAVVWRTISEFAALAAASRSAAAVQQPPISGAVVAADADRSWLYASTGALTPLWQVDVGARGDDETRVADDGGRLADAVFGGSFSEWCTGRMRF